MKCIEAVQVVRVGHEFDESSGGGFGSGFRSTVGLLGGPFDLVSRVSKVGYGDYIRVSRGY